MLDTEWGFYIGPWGAQLHNRRAYAENRPTGRDRGACTVPILVLRGELIRVGGAVAFHEGLGRSIFGRVDARKRGEGELEKE